MKKIINLINNERINTLIHSKKAVTDNAACYNGAADICSYIDNDGCSIYAHDNCQKDYASCVGVESVDICSIDYAACFNGTLDICNQVDTTACYSPNAEDMT